MSICFESDTRCGCLNEFLSSLSPFVFGFVLITVLEDAEVLIFGIQLILAELS